MRRKSGHSRNGKPSRKRKFSFRAGARVKGVKADVAGRELERIRKSRGRLVPEEIVEEAESKSSPLHSVFEWDNETCGREHRLWQARQLIRSVCVEYIDQPDSFPSAVYVHVPGEDACYQPMSIVAKTPEMFDAALAELKTKLASAQRSCDELLSAYNDAIDPKRVLKIENVGKALERAAVAAAAV